MHGSRYYRTGAADLSLADTSPAVLATATATATALQQQRLMLVQCGAGAAAGDDPTLGAAGGLWRSGSTKELDAPSSGSGCANRNLDVDTSIRIP
jgi:hypothetical protein